MSSEALSSTDVFRLSDLAGEQPMPRTIPRPHPGGFDQKAIIDAFAFRMMYSVARDQNNATDLDAYQALAFAVRDRLMERWFATQDLYYQQDVKRVYYLSLEFLLGRLLVSNAINLGAPDNYGQAMRRLGFSLETLAESENDAGLGNGGLGRLAACFLDSASTLALPFYGYGIRYEYGIFRQKIVEGWQTEQPDNWLRYGTPWEVPRPDVLFPVKFYGRSEHYVDERGQSRYRWVDTQDVYAMAYDFAVPGYRNDTVNSLRLWGAKSSREFDLAEFNEGDYVDAVEDKTRTETISKVLYPADDRYAGRELRLKQQHFFVSATIQDVIRRFAKHGRRDWQHLPEKVAIQLNDTHPSIAIAEMMRVLIDEQSVEWEAAWSIGQRVFAYTNHTVLPEALEVWPKDLVGRLLPRHLQIIEEIDRRFRQVVVQTFGSDLDRVKRLAVIDDGAQNVRMAHLAIVGSHSVNGVSRLHTDILEQRVFPEFRQIYPGKFNNKTNGITPRRWMVQANPDLSKLITSAIGDRWPNDLERLRELEKFADDAAFRASWVEVKQKRKTVLAAWLLRFHGITADPATLFDVQIKRIHEYKRQLLNVMHVIALYNRISDGDDSVVPRTVILGGKAAPSYHLAKLVIKLVHEVAALVRSSARASQLLNVIFVPNYDVSSAEVLFPATELSEQISTAGTEASGTGNMKAVLNGGVIIGTLDGANVEIAEAVGRENIFIFGKTAEEIEALKAGGYSPGACLLENEPLRRVVDWITRQDVFKPLVHAIAENDRYFHCADFPSYVDTQRMAGATWLQRDEWTRKSILNVARSGCFSADRTVAQYAREIWNVEPVPVKLEE